MKKLLRVIGLSLCSVALTANANSLESELEKYQEKELKEENTANIYICSKPENNIAIEEKENWSCLFTSFDITTNYIYDSTQKITKENAVESVKIEKNNGVTQVYVNELEEEIRSGIIIKNTDQDFLLSMTELMGFFSVETTQGEYFIPQIESRVIENKIYSGFFLEEKMGNRYLKIEIN